MHNKLPSFEGYIVDVRLRQFRKIIDKNIVFIEFNSAIGEEMLSRYIKYLDPKSEEFKILLGVL